MSTVPLRFRDGHLFLELAGRHWFVDTGAPTSFGTEPVVRIGGDGYAVAGSHVGLTVADIAPYVGGDLAGLLGADILGRFDFAFDVANGTAELTTDTLAVSGTAIPLDDYMGVPIVPARVRGDDYRMFFDTGAQFSYFLHGSLASFPPAGRVTDFFPTMGPFESPTHHVDVVVGEVALTLRCGTLPEPLRSALTVVGVEGVVGNEVFRDRTVGYFPRRRLLVL
jgi:hypothetical protein